MEITRPVECIYLCGFIWLIYILSIDLGNSYSFLKDGAGVLGWKIVYLVEETAWHFSF